MYAIRILLNYKIIVISILNINTFYYTYRYTYSDIEQNYLREIDDVHLNKVTVLEFDKTGKYIYSACMDNDVSVSDVETGHIKAYFEEAHTAGLVYLNLANFYNLV